MTRVSRSEPGARGAETAGAVAMVSFPALADEPGINVTWARKPAVIRVTDAVKPGGAFSVFGEGFIPETMTVYIAPTVSDSRPAEPPPGAVGARVIQTDAEAQSVTAVMPEAAAPGLYDVWIENAYGLSKPAQLNAARPQWLSIDVIAAGLSVKLTGRNMDGREFGSAQNSRVKLTGGGEYFADVLSVNPFAVDFTVSGAVPAGMYDVLVSNHKLLWKLLIDRDLSKGDFRRVTGISSATS